MKKVTKKILTAAGAAAAVTAVSGIAAYATTKLWVKIALDREEPKLAKKVMNRIAGGKKDTDFENATKEAAKELESKELETVKITGSDGVELIGHFYPCRNSRRVIIAFHGWRSSWLYDYGLISDFWHKNDCSILYVDQRGQNGSGGEYIGFGLTERYDCIDWINWAMCRCGKRMPIYLAGVSMGAATVLMASDLKFPQCNICGIMADCGFTSPKAIWKYVAKNNLHMAYGIRSALIDAMCRQKINVGSGDHSTIDALKKTHIPVLFIHGSDDRFVPVEMTYENYKACASPKRLLIVPGANHAMSYYVNRYEYEKAVKEFWNDFDKVIFD